MSGKVEYTWSDLANGPGSGGISLNRTYLYIRTPGGEWLKTDRPMMEVRQTLQRLGFEMEEQATKLPV